VHARQRVEPTGTNRPRAWIEQLVLALECLRRVTTSLTTDFGGHGDRVTPVPISNTEVKPVSADGTWGFTPWESRTPPDFSRQRALSETRAPVARPERARFTVVLRWRWVRGTLRAVLGHEVSDRHVIRHQLLTAPVISPSVVSDGAAHTNPIAHTTGLDVVHAGPYLPSGVLQTRRRAWPKPSPHGSRANATASKLVSQSTRTSMAISDGPQRDNSELTTSAWFTSQFAR
jgi:hypothetical protein